MVDPAYEYVGEELEFFAEAANWKAYLAEQIRPFLGRSVLEVGAGIGATAKAFCTSAQAHWIGLEPDPRLTSRANAAVRAGELPPICEFRVATAEDLPGTECFTSIIYIDVLEHIEHDAAELVRSVRHLEGGGHLVVLSPAHQWLYSPFDRAIGHYRRYARSSLEAVVPEGLRLVHLRYLDACGMFASLANRLLLRQDLPTRTQVATWDRFIVPVSRRADPLLGYSVGKSILGVWQARGFEGTP